MIPKTQFASLTHQNEHVGWRKYLIWCKRDSSSLNVEHEMSQNVFEDEGKWTPVNLDFVSARSKYSKKNQT